MNSQHRDFKLKHTRVKIQLEMQAMEHSCYFDRIPKPEIIDHPEEAEN